jgi:hypothetical protein
MTDYGSPPQLPLWEGSRKPASKLTLQKTFIAKGDITKSSAESIDLSFSSTWIEYRESGEEGKPVVSGNKITAESSQDLESKTYLAYLPVTMIAGKPEKAVSFLNYVSHQYHGHTDLDGISLEIAVDLLSDEGVKLGSSDTLNAIFFLKNFYSYDEGGPTILQQTNDDTTSSQKLATEFISRNAILINRYVFEELKISFTNGDSPNHLLHIIGFLTDLSSGVPVLKKNLTETEQNIINRILDNMEVEDPVKSLDLIKKYFERLYDFPISTAAIELQQVGGTFSITGADDVLLTEADFAQYDLSLEYNSLNADGQSEMVYLHYDWNDFRGKVTNNTVNFSFSSSHLIVPAEDHELFMVYIRAADGMELWSKEYKAGSAALRNIHIAITRPGGNMVKPGDVAVANPKRLRGQILDMTGQKPVLTGAKVVIEAKGAGDTDWRIIGSALSDKDGYFSLPYPKGVYTSAQAVVSLMPDSPAAIPVHADKGDSRTISDDFIYLLLKAITVPLPDKHDEDDCDCHNTLKATRLPDHADLIHADEYTQDLGAGCINLSTPNRTLKEYNHYAVVRTSDPDVANYTLVRDANGAFTLTGEKKKIRRKNIDLNNPIRWQDAPDTNAVISTDPGEPTDNSHSNLSFYQAVTISTGHILHYKSMFKADGYSLGELIYSLPLAPGQKKQIVVFDSQHNLQGSESQQLSVSERLAANITNDRDVVDQLSGSIGESLRGRSSAETGGVAAAAGVAGSGGAVSGAVGIAGGYAMAGSNASQDSARDISQFFSEKLRNNVMQNADSYRQQNASVVSTVREGQTYSASTEVVANHNHCHSLTMMYFEVLRHYAIYQELTSVEECVFVPLLMTNFTQDNIFKWRDVLAANLLPLPSNTYLPSVDGQHPLARAFDANERIRADWKNVDFPEGRYCDEPVSAIKGWMQLRINLPRPRTRYDRILSFPLIERKEGGVSAWDAFRNAMIAPFTLGIPVYGSPERNVQGRAKIFDAFMTLEANWESVPPAQSIRITNFGNTFNTSGEFGDVFKSTSFQVFSNDFFDGNETDRLAWEAYATILGKKDAFALLNQYFKDQIIGDWDRIFYENVATPLYEKLINEKLTIAGISKTEFTPVGRYYRGEAVMLINLYGTTSQTRAQMPEKLELKASNDLNLKNLTGTGILRIENIHLTYTTAHYSNLLYAGYVGQDLDTGADMDIPLTEADRRSPKTEDRFVVSRLIDHLNSNLEHYNKVLWYNLDADRRYMLLDGFNVQVFNDFGVPVGLKSLSSVIKNELITVAGNSMVFPVSPGFKIGRSYLVEKTTTGETERVGLLEHYKPLTPPAPYRISVPTKGLFMEAVKGQCDACEKVEPNTSQDWNIFKPDEPTAINAITPPTPTITDWKATFKDIASATVGMQQAPTAPAVGAGLEGLSTALTKSDTFKDVTGLAGNQQNAASTYKANIEAATKMAEIAKGLATQEHNTDKSSQIMDKLKDAKASGAITSDDYNKLVKQHLQQQIDGGDAARTQATAEAKRAEANKPSITDAAVSAINKGNTPVKATKTDGAGNVESVEIGSAGSNTSGSGSSETNTLPTDGGNVLAKTDKPVPRIAQKDNVGCWGAAAAMMVSWKLGMPSKDKPGELIAQDIVDVVRAAGEYFVNLYTGTPNASPKGLPVSDKQRLLSALRMTAEEPKCYEPSYYIQLLEKYGPLWLTTDAATNDPHLGLHARILVRITGTNANADNLYFHFNDPAKPNEEQHIPFKQFQKEYDEAVKDTKSTTLFNQVFHFKEEKSWEKRIDWEGEAAEEKAAIKADIADAIAQGYMVPDEENPAEGYKVAGPFNIPFKTAPVHETLTLAALRKSEFDLPANASVPINTSIGTNLDVNEFFRGVIWNDDPGCLLFEDDYFRNSDNMNYVTGASWWHNYHYGETHPDDRTNITTRTHNGDLQFLHCMAEVAGEDPYDTLAKVMLWAEFTYRLAISDASSGGAIANSLLENISLTTKGKKSKTEFNFGMFFKPGTDPDNKFSVRKLFLRDTQYKAPILVRRALGSLLHTIQDSYAIGHTKREILNPEDLLPGAPHKFKKGTYGKYGAILNFHSYAGQGSEHGAWDIVGIAGMDSRNLESFNRIPGGRNALDHSIQMINYWVNKTPWESGPKEYLETKVFVVHKDATPAVNKID